MDGARQILPGYGMPLCRLVGPRCPALTPRRRPGSPADLPPSGFSIPILKRLGRWVIFSLGLHAGRVVNPLGGLEPGSAGGGENAMSTKRIAGETVHRQGL
jgi:hypothetical protein